MHVTQSLQIDDQFTTTVEITGPDDARECIIFSHGFGACRDARDLFTDIVARLSDTYICVQFDYNQIDEQGNMVSALYSRMQQTLESVIAYV